MSDDEVFEWFLNAYRRLFAYALVYIKEYPIDNLILGVYDDLDSNVARYLLTRYSIDYSIKKVIDDMRKNNNFYEGVIRDSTTRSDKDEAYHFIESLKNK